MREAETVPAWFQRRRIRRLERHGGDRVVRWIAVQSIKGPAARETAERPDGWSNDNVVPINARIAI